MNSIQNYHTNKIQYLELTQPHLQARAKAAALLDEEKKKTLEIRHRDIKKKNCDNIAKLQHLFNQKRQNLEQKQTKLMEQSSIRRINYLKSLCGSYHYSQDKRYHLKARQSKQLQRSLILLEENNRKTKVALQRKESYINDLKYSLKQKNQQIGEIQQYCRKQDDLKQSQLLHKLVQKMEHTQQSQQGRANESNRSLQQKKKEQYKNKQKHIKRRSILLQAKEKERQMQNQKVEDKIWKANLARQSHLQTITNNLQTKRQLKEKEQYYSTLYQAKEQEQKIEEISLKHYQSQQQFYSLKQQKQKLRSQNFFQYCQSSLRR